MLALALGVLLLPAQATCSPDAAALVEDATGRAAEFDLAGASRQLTGAATRGCESAGVAALYVRGLVDAHEAFRQGGSPESLGPVRQAAARDRIAVARILYGRRDEDA